MMGALRLVALNAVALLGFGVVIAATAALAHRAVLGAVRGLPPASRARVLLAWAAAPAALATALVGLALAPSIGVAVGLADDHCPSHLGHLHLCLHHLPTRGPGILGALVLSSATIAVGLAVARAGRSWALAARLRRAAAFHLAPGVAAVPSARAFAGAVGWLRPEVLVSTTLADRLTPAQLEVVVAHERAHASRRDALAATAARVLALAHLPSVRRELLRELTLACERACDEAAARICGDRLLVAETIVAAERAAASPRPAAAGIAFGGGDVATRVEALLAVPAEDASPRPLRWLVLAAGVAALALALAAPHVHHWTETVLHHLPH